MTVENMNGIDVPALKAFVDRVKTDPDQRAVTFRVKTEWKGQTKTITSISDYTLGDKKYSRDFQIYADEPHELLGWNTAPNPQELLMAALKACLSVGYAEISVHTCTIGIPGWEDVMNRKLVDPT
jgi:hypothetical protein